ncbi:MAG TPA: polyprenyl synthetase family protein [Solirubrobacteraceae bacterium]|nr:polyprenyl synthetase family protein [Solirubrobacteraceae bacterium]
MRNAVRERAGEDEEAIAEIMRRGGPLLRARMVSTEEHLELVTAQAGAPLAAHATATVLAGGKRLRPLLVVLAATVVGGGDAGGDAGGDERGSDQPLVRAAVAVELVHSATLVHDDVIDGAQLRRGHPSVVARAGRRAAIATGDLLFSRAFAELARNGDVAQLRALSDASSALAEGELLQREDAYAAQVALERYLRRCELKTAALFEAACRLGALVAAGATAESDEASAEVSGLAGSLMAAPESAGTLAPGAALADALGAFARRIGLAFQLLDDVLDVCGPVERTGKPRGTDLLDGTVTLPLILARAHDPRLTEIDLAALDGPEQAAELCDRIAATGALEEARSRALALVAGAKAMLPAILPDGRAALLDLVADAVVERYR